MRAQEPKPKPFCLASLLGTLRNWIATDECRELAAAI